MANEKPTHENKPTTQYSKEGVNLRDLLAFQTAESGSFDKVLSKAGISRKDADRLRKAYNTVNNSNYDYILSEDGSGFNVFDRETGNAQTKSSRAAGNTKGVNLADLVQLGDNVSKLAGFAAGSMDSYRKSLGAPREAAAPPPQMKSSDANVGGTPMDLADFPAPGVRGRRTVSNSNNSNANAANKASGTPPPATPGTPAVNQRFEDLLRRYQEGSNPYRFRGVATDHLDKVREQFKNKFFGVEALQLDALGSGFAPSSNKALEELTAHKAEGALQIYQQMIQDGYEPDVNEIAEIINNEDISRFEGGNAMGVQTAGMLLSAGGLGSLFAGARGAAAARGLAGMKNLASKYPKFARWVASKGAGKSVKVPTPQQLPPTVSGGARRFLQGGAKEYMDRARTIREMSRRMSYEGAGRAKPTPKLDWEWMNERIGSGFGQGGKLPLQRNAEMASTMFRRAMNSVSRQFMGDIWDPKTPKFSVKSLMK